MAISIYSRLILKCHNILKNHLHKQQLNLFKHECKSIGKNPKIAFPVATYGLDNVSIGDNFTLGERSRLRTYSYWEGTKYNPQIIIGNNVNIAADTQISAINSVIIEDGVLTASFVYISDLFHGEICPNELSTPPFFRPLSSKGPIKICKNVWLGERVCVMPNVTIGEGSIIGANSVVTKDIPPYSVACGIPAKVIKTLK